MTAVVSAISALYFMSAIIVLLSKTNFQGVIWFGIMGSLSAVAMLIIGAPDVAMTQFTVGVALVLTVYIMALRRQRRVRLGYVKTHSMIELTPAGFAGVEWEILQTIGKKEGYHIETTLFDTKKEAISAVDEHRVDFLCGGFTEADGTTTTSVIPYLETSIFLCDGEEVDFARLKQKSRETLKPVFLRKTRYAFIVSKTSKDLLDDLKEDIVELENSGKLREIVERYL